MANTPHIGLHQWQPDDDFLREEFNQDFAKIDTAIKNLEAAMPRVLLKKHTTTVSAQQVDVSLADIRFSDYWSLEIYFKGNYSQAITALLRVDGRGGGSDYVTRNMFSGSENAVNYLAYIQLGDNCTYLTLDCGGKMPSVKYHIVGDTNNAYSGYMYSAGGVPLAAMSQLNLVGNSISLPAGTEITIYGVRK